MSESISALRIQKHWKHYKYYNLALRLSQISCYEDKLIRELSGFIHYIPRRLKTFKSRLGIKLVERYRTYEDMEVAYNNSYENTLLLFYYFLVSNFTN